jgi:hypothetical protein
MMVKEDFKQFLVPLDIIICGSKVSLTTVEFSNGNNHESIELHEFKLSGVSITGIIAIVGGEDSNACAGRDCLAPRPGHIADAKAGKYQFRCLANISNDNKNGMLAHVVDVDIVACPFNFFDMVSEQVISDAITHKLTHHVYDQVTQHRHLTMVEQLVIVEEAPDPNHWKKPVMTFTRNGIGQAYKGGGIDVSKPAHSKYDPFALANGEVARLSHALKGI